MKINTRFFNPPALAAMLLALSLLGGVVTARAGVVSAKPACTISSPAHNAIVTNSPVTVKGTTHDNVAVTNVVYEVNGTGGWIQIPPSNGFTNWSAQVALAAGPNTIKVYAINAAGQTSATNSLSVFYRVLTPLSLSVNGPGKVRPDDNSSNLVIGRSYSMTAFPEAGCKLIDWSVSVNSSNPSNSTSPTLKFTMAAGLSITANFKDVTPPIISIAAPAATKGKNSVVTLTGRTRVPVANFGVQSVYYTINGGPVNKTVATTNGYTNWTAVLILSPGTNDVKFYAEDTAGNTSAAASIKLEDQSSGFAPQSLSGVIMTTDPGTSTNRSMYFGMSTYALPLSAGYAVFDYTFTQVNSNTAQIIYSFVAPFPGDKIAMTLGFSNSTSGTYTNEDGVSGTFTLGGETGLAPLSLDRTTLELRGYTSSSSVSFTNGTFTWDTLSSGNVGSGTYTYALYAPQMALLTATYTDNVDAGITNSVLLNFDGEGGVIVEAASKDTAAVSDITSRGSFSFASAGLTTVTFDSGFFTTTNPATAPSGYAPESLAGRMLAVTSRHTQTNDGKTNVALTTSLVSFGDATFGQITSITNNDSDVGNYIYTRTGPDTGLLSFYPIAPPPDINDNNKNTGIVLNFSSSGGSFTNGNDRGKIALSQRAATVPASLVGSTLRFSVDGTVATFGYDSGTVVDSGQANPFTYAFGQFGPQVALLQVISESNTNYLTLWFTSAAPPAGKYVSTKIPAVGVPIGTSGTFKP